jgi:hypothetical protein
MQSTPKRKSCYAPTSAKPKKVTVVHAKFWVNGENSNLPITAFT